MKTAKITFALALIGALAFSFIACKKDKNDPDDAGSSYYQYADIKYKISSANEKHLGGDIFLEFTPTTPGNYLQINFANTNIIPEGMLTYHADRNAGYNPQTNFWSTAIGFEGNSIQVSGGTINVSKSGGTYKIVFSIDTANGKITGEYNGTPSVTD